MSTYEVAYCNANDLQALLPSIGEYDRKFVVTGWAAEGTSNVYQCASVGDVSLLYRDGIELTSEANLSNLKANENNGEYFYDSALDIVYLFSTTSPITAHIMEKGKDFSDVQDEAINRASELVRSIVGKPIYPKKGTGYQDESLRDYDEVIILSTAGIAVSMMVSPYDRELANEIEKKYNDPETGLGYLQLIRSGEMDLHNEISRSLQKGELLEVSLNGSTTGGLVDLNGNATASDIFKIWISDDGNSGSGASFTYGSASSVKYSVAIGDSTGLMIQTAVDGDEINGQEQSLAHGLSGFFTPGTYYTNDTWYVQCRSGAVESHDALKTIEARRY